MCTELSVDVFLYDPVGIMQIRVSLSKLALIIFSMLIFPEPLVLL